MEDHPELLDVTVLKASHHGSINGADGMVNDTTWMEVVDPEAVVISAHLDTQHGHPHPKAVEIYQASVGPDDVYRTSRQGTFRVHGRQDGSFANYRQFVRGGSCAFGTLVEG